MKTIRGLFGNIVAMHLAFGVFALAPRPARAEPHWYNCRATAVIEASGEIRVFCSNNYSPTVNSLAIKTMGKSDADLARFVSMASAAVLSGRQFRAFATEQACGIASCTLVSSWSLWVP